MKQAFTLIEILLVIVIIAILSTITLNLSRSRIGQMEALTDKEQRIWRHRSTNNLFTTSNFRQNTKTPVISMIYSWSSISITTGQDTPPLDIFVFKHHTIAEAITLTKTWLQLWCSWWTESTTLKLNWPNNTPSCFTLNTDLCQRQDIKQCE